MRTAENIIIAIHLARGKIECSLPWCRADVDLLAVAVPGVNPAAVAGGECVAGHAQHFAHAAFAHRVVFLPFRIPEIDPAAIYAYHKCGAVALHFTHAGGGEGLIFATRFVVEIYPSATGFDRGYAVRVCSHNQN